MQFDYDARQLLITLEVLAGDDDALIENYRQTIAQFRTKLIEKLN